jgi:uncharacterized protein
MRLNLSTPAKNIGLAFLLMLFFEQTVIASSPVWKIENGKNTLYLGGTIHILRQSDYPLPRAFETAYQKSQLVTFEVDIAQSKTPEFNQALLKAVLLPPGKTLHDYINDETYRLLLDYLQRNHLTIQQFNGLKPSMLAITLTMLEIHKMGVDGQGVDEHFYARASTDGKTREALESIQQQIDFIAQMGAGVEDEMIRQTLTDIAKLHTEFDSMTASWRNGDRKQLEELFVKPMREQFEPVYQQLLVQRNQNWMPKIKNYLQTPTTEFVMVGSAHLVGPDGLIQQLKKAGYRISQLD